MAMRLDHGTDELEEVHGINVTPFIDVMLVLLIIFMVTAPMLATGVKVNLPSARTAQPLENKEPVVVAVAKDGARYAALGTAFIYRQQLVANCTCNGRNARGLAPFDLSSDPTLRPGDIVSTKDGFVAYTGKPGQADAFTPVDPASISTELNSDTSHLAVVPRRGKETLADADASSPPAPPVNLGAPMRGQIAR